MTLKTHMSGAVVLLAFICAAWAEPASADLEEARAHLSKGEYAESIRLLKPLVEAGDPAAMNAMGFHLDNGYGVAKDSRAAAEYYRKAAEKGNAVAQFNLAAMVKKGRGIGVPRADRMAAVWFRKAAEHGDGDAQFELGSMYREGRGVPSDAVSAYAWLALAASADTADKEAARSLDEVSKVMTPALLSEGKRLAATWKPHEPLAASRLKPVSVDALTTAFVDRVIHQTKQAVGNRNWPDAQTAQSQAAAFPVRPDVKPGRTTCTTRCLNGDCYRTYDDGRKVQFQAKQKWNSLNNQFEWDSGTC